MPSTVLEAPLGPVPVDTRVRHRISRREGVVLAETPPEFAGHGTSNQWIRWDDGTATHSADWATHVDIISLPNADDRSLTVGDRVHIRPDLRMPDMGNMYRGGVITRFFDNHEMCEIRCDDGERQRWETRRLERIEADAPAEWVAVTSRNQVPVGTRIRIAERHAGDFNGVLGEVILNDDRWVRWRPLPAERQERPISQSVMLAPDRGWHTAIDLMEVQASQPVTAPEQSLEERYAIGTILRITEGSTQSGYFNAGDIVKVVRPITSRTSAHGLDNSRGYVAVSRLTDGEDWISDQSDWVPLDRTYYNCRIEELPVPSELNIGDRVICVGSTGHANTSPHAIGLMGTIVESEITHHEGERYPLAHFDAVNVGMPARQLHVLAHNLRKIDAPAPTESEAESSTSQDGDRVNARLTISLVLRDACTAEPSSVQSYMVSAVQQGQSSARQADQSLPPIQLVNAMDSRSITIVESSRTTETGRTECCGELVVASIRENVVRRGSAYWDNADEVWRVNERMWTEDSDHDDISFECAGCGDYVNLDDIGVTNDDCCDIMEVLS